MKKRLPAFAFFLMLSGAMFGQVWEPKAVGLLPANYNVADICIVNEQIIWATAIDWAVGQPVPATFVSKLLKSTDGGETWEVKDIEEAMGRFCWDIHAFDENTACITTTNRGSGSKRGIFRTTDGGATWTEVFNQHAGGVWLHFFDGQEGVCGSSTGIARTTDGGLNWVQASIPVFLSGEGMVFSALSNGIGTFGNSVWFGTTQGRIFKTENRGQTWAAYNTGLGANTTLYSFGFIDEKNGLGVYDLPGGADHESIVRTTDGGLTWEDTGNKDFGEVDAIPCANTFFGGYFKRTGFSSDFGATWTEVDTMRDGSGFVFLNPENGWMPTFEPVGSGPALYKWIGGSLDTRIYVNKNAGGANTGRLWTDAFTDLQTALAAAQAGDEIWVAEGTYTPAAPGGNQASTFLIDKNLKLYGGFAGSECTLSERSPALHPTVLSGDLLGDDVPDDFTSNRGDNVLHVVTTTASTTDETLLDGFVIRNGQADGSQLDDQRGGGLYAFGSLAIRNCLFTQNVAKLNGGGMIARNLSTTNGTSLEVSHCVFEKNRTTGSDGGGLSFLCLGQNSTYAVAHCQFKENGAQSEGGGFAIQVSPNANSATFSVDSCQFTQNQANVGGGMLIQSAKSFTVSGCAFSGNEAQTGAMQASGGGLKIDASSGQVNHCDFIGNHSALFGGGLSAIDYLGAPGNNTVEVLDCNFEGNSTENNDGGLSFNSWVNNNRYIAKRCTFDGNTAANSGGGMSFHVSTSSSNAKMLVDDCVFSKNTAVENASALLVNCGGKTADIEVNNCRFSGNTTDNYSAAANFWGNSGATGTVTLDSCLFDNNTASWSAAVEMGNGNFGTGTQVNYRLTNSTFKNNHGMEGGAITLWSDAVSKADFLVENCLVEGNSSATKFGGGLTFLASSTNYHVTVKRTKIIGNQSPTNGAFDISQFLPGIPFPQNASVLFENCLISGNIGGKAAILADSMPNLHFLNCTIADNVGGGIQLSDKSGLRLQNTILHNPGFLNYEALTADVSYTSAGGNLSSDLSLSVTSTDQMNLNPVFMGGGDYRLATGSPAIDKGVDLGNLPVTDLDGNPRVNGCVDIGAYESAVVVSTECVVSSEEAVSAGLLRLSPNPTTDFLALDLPETAAVQVFDIAGQLVLEKLLPAGQRLDLAGLAPGVFFLKAAAGERVYAGRFVKQ